LIDDVVLRVRLGQVQAQLVVVGAVAATETAMPCPRTHENAVSVLAPGVYEVVVRVGVKVVVAEFRHGWDLTGEGAKN
jgi:hypothetical protein